MVESVRPTDKIIPVKTVRILDVFFVGPVLIYTGFKTKGMLAVILILIGVMTILYNGINLYSIESGKLKVEN